MDGSVFLSMLDNDVTLKDVPEHVWIEPATFLNTKRRVYPPMISPLSMFLATVVVLSTNTYYLSK